MNNLAAEFIQALRLYFSNPNEKEYRNQLVRVSYSVLNDIQKETGIAADNYMDGIDVFLKRCSLDSIKITEKKSKLLDNFIRGLSLMDDMNIRQASNVLLLAHHYYFKQHFITHAEDKVRTQLFVFRYAVSKIGNINTAKTMNEMCDRLTALVGVHFSMPLSEQKTNYPALSLTVNKMISASKETIEKDFLLKKIALNLVAAVAGLGVFYGLYLMVTATKRNTFFLQPAESVYLQNELDKAHDHVIAIRQEMQLDDPDQPTFATIVNLFCVLSWNYVILKEIVMPIKYSVDAMLQGAIKESFESIYKNNLCALSRIPSNVLVNPVTQIQNLDKNICVNVTARPFRDRPT